MGTSSEVLSYEWRCFCQIEKLHYLCLRNLTSNIMHAFHADINKRLSIVSAPSSMMGDALRKDSTLHVGAYELCSNSSDKYFFANGYIDIEQGHVKAYCYYAKDHLGNVRHVDMANPRTNRNEIVQITNYYPFGGILNESFNRVDYQNKLYNGKELDRMHGLNLYNYSARQYDAALCQFTSMDPLCEKYYHISPYAYCAGNPVKYVDPDGRETWVAANEDGTYRVIGGVLNKDRNIYVYTQDKNGNYTVKGESIGVTSSTTSFYNSDKGKWAIDAQINPNDNSGKEFLNKMVSENITLDDYIDNARNNHAYDFKVTNGGEKAISKKNTYIYRGMSIGKTSSGQTIYTSARDVGNMAAGIVAAKNGLSWGASRVAFDAYQSRLGLQMEGISTRNAEYYGWSQIHSRMDGVSEAVHLRNTVNSTIKKILNKLLK